MPLPLLFDDCFVMYHSDAKMPTDQNPTSACKLTLGIVLRLWYTSSEWWLQAEHHDVVDILAWCCDYPISGKHHVDMSIYTKQVLQLRARLPVYKGPMHLDYVCSPLLQSLPNVCILDSSVTRLAWGAAVLQETQIAVHSIAS